MGQKHSLARSADRAEWTQRRLARVSGAKAQRLIVVEPGPCDVQIDLDGVRAVRHFARQWFFLERAKLTRGWTAKITPSPSGRANRCHVVITLPTRRPLKERVLLAALLGDDPTRAAFNYVRTVKRRPFPVLFFEKLKRDEARYHKKLSHAH